MKPFFVLNIFLLPLIFCETQNGEFQQAFRKMAPEMKVPDASLHGGATAFDGSKFRNAPIPIPMLLSNNVLPAKPTACENTKLLLKLLSTLLELLGDQKLEFGKDKYLLALMKKYLDDAPESPERNEMINKVRILQANVYKKPETLRNLYQPRTQILFKTDIPKINQRTCKEALESLIQNAYNTYLQLSSFPLCQQTNQYSNMNFDFTHRPQDLSFDIKVFSPIEYLYHQQIPNKDANLFYTQVNPAGPSNDLVTYLQSQGLNKNWDIKSILQNYRPGQIVITGNGHLPNNEAPVMNIDSQNKQPLHPVTNFVKEPSSDPVLDLTKVYNPNDQKQYIYLTPDNPGNAKQLEVFNNKNYKKRNEVPSENLQLPINEWKPPLNIILDDINNQTIKHPTLEDIAQLLQGDQNFPANPSSNDSNLPLNTNNNYLDTLTIAQPNNVNNGNYQPHNTLLHVIPKENEAVPNLNKNPNSVIVALLNKYLPKNNNGQFVVWPNVNNLEELAKLFAKDTVSQNYVNDNNPRHPVIDSVTLSKLIGLFPKDIPNNQTPNNILTPNLANGNRPHEQAFDANTLEKLTYDLINNLNPNVNTPNTDQGNVNIVVNPGINNNQNTYPYLDNNKFVAHPNLVLNPNVNPNTVQTINYFKPNNQQSDLTGFQLYPGSEVNQLQAPDLQRLLAANLLKLNPRPNIAQIIELTYLLKRPRPLIYQPYYYVKYKLPYVTFINNLYSLIRNKPNLRSSPARLYQEIISLSNVTDMSPEIKGIGKDDIRQLLLKNGALINAKILNGNDTFLNKQLKIIQNLNAEMRPEELLKLLNDNIKQNQTLSDNNEKVSMASDSLKTNNHVPIHDVPINDVPINDVPINDVPINGVPINVVPINDVPINDVPINDVPINDVPINDVPINDVPINGVPINNVPINHVPINNVPINNVPINNVPINNVPINNVPINNVPINNVLINKVPIQSNFAPAVNVPPQNMFNSKPPYNNPSAFYPSRVANLALG